MGTQPGARQFKLDINPFHTVHRPNSRKCTKIVAKLSHKVPLKQELKRFIYVFSHSSQVCVRASLEVNETQQHSNNVYHDMGLTRNKIVTAQFECYQKIMKDTTHNREGSFSFMSLKFNAL